MEARLVVSVPPTLTLGIDLAAQPSRTAACLLSWGERRARLERLVVGADDDRLSTMRSGVAMTAIDAPFGWPIPFVNAVSSWQERAAWPDTAPADLRLRTADKAVIARLGVHPLSVSSDRIGVCAWRCASLLSRWGVTDLMGGQGVAEVYPAAASRSWNLPSTGSRRLPAVRTERLRAIRDACTWLEASDPDWACMTASDHALDALICALVGRAIVAGCSAEVPPELRSAAEREGWIHVPTGELAALVSG